LFQAQNAFILSKTLIIICEKINFLANKTLFLAAFQYEFCVNFCPKLHFIFIISRCFFD